jgi:nitrite reductase/ring-hydroxylating ferredoxin subunit
MSEGTSKSKFNSNLKFAAALSDVRSRGCLALRVDGHTLALFAQGEQVFAVDNRCPHMGFPLHRGTVKDGILTCHWHHARFDLASGGTFDLFADDVPTFPVEIRGGEVWVDLSPRPGGRERQLGRLRDGLERDISLVVAKAVIGLLETGDPVEPFRTGLEFGVRYRRAGWGQGLTILTCMMNLVPDLSPEDRPRALYHGLSAVARDSDGEPPRFLVGPLPGSGTANPGTLKRWFRRFVEVRDAEGAERCLVSALRFGASPSQVAGMLFAAATDHRYIDGGHTLDFTNKALEALDRAGWQAAEGVLSSLAPRLADASRMEESNAWRNPVDLVAILEDAFESLPAILEQKSRQDWGGRPALANTLLEAEPQDILAAMLEALKDGSTPEALAGAVAYAAALRIARFHTSNEFGDWDTALHTFTFANAVHQGMRRAPSPELLRGAFDAAMSVYLDRFLNVPPARLPEPPQDRGNPAGLLDELPDLLNRQQQVNEAGEAVASYLFRGGEPARLKAVLGRLLLREDRDFHTIQTIEAAFQQHRLLEGGPQAGRPEAVYVLAAAARYLAAHAPTMRAQGQTYEIAQRLQRGERIYEEELS